MEAVWGWCWSAIDSEWFWALKYWPVGDYEVKSAQVPRLRPIARSRSFRSEGHFRPWRKGR